jgi:hypothetical protein
MKRPDGPKSNAGPGSQIKQASTKLKRPQHQ